MGIQRTVHVGPFGPGRQIGGMFFGGPNGGSGIARLIVMFLFVILFVAIAYMVIRHFDHAQSHHHSNANSTTSSASADSAAADVLKMRFAKGEIDEDEFTRRMSLLKEHQTIS